MEQTTLPARATPVPSQDMTSTQARKVLNIHRNTILKLLRRGEFPGAYRVGGTGGNWRIPYSALEAFRAARRKEAGAA